MQPRFNRAGLLPRLMTSAPGLNLTSGGRGINRSILKGRRRMARWRYPARRAQARLARRAFTSAACGTTAASCSATRSILSFHLWKNNSRNIQKKYHILNQELLITDLKREDAGSYRCTVSNTYLNKNKTSPEGVVQVKKSTDTELSWLPVHNDTLVVKPRGSKVVLACPLIWELTTPGGRPAELESSDEVLVLPNLQHDQQGMYSCYVEGRSDIVKVIYPVSITLPPVSKQAMRASTVRFNCTAEGSPEPRITCSSSVASPLTTQLGRARRDGRRCGCSGGGAVCAHRALLRGAVPHNNTSEIVKVKEALTPYYFQVRAYIPSTSKNIASDMSESVMCQGQGVPIKLIKLEDDEILVTWKQFAEENPGVVEWVLQYTDGSDTERHTNVTLPEDVYNYTLTAGVR
ncbi:unnamed protein product [Leptidea sinapis]|uniref:Ig-like domain-containing protein n=1 Tax=Leptidea sinapis TaxID=189913 RepID=A0A5E4R5J3_9NEOP|nr:unnamed protein product [Leptidea sinapis]